MIQIKEQDQTFRVRVCGVFIHNDKVLLHRKKHEQVWALPGGRGEIGETTANTIIREMKEEIGMDVKIDRLLWVAESFYPYHGNIHEIGFFYLLNLAQDSIPKEIAFSGIEEATHLHFEWFPIQMLDKMALYPSFLRHGIQHLPEQVEHLVHSDY